jgi:hypothetical protein
MAAEMSEAHRRRGDVESGASEVFEVPCFSLVTVLKALAIKRVDYFSLDVEGWRLVVRQAVNYLPTRFHYLRSRFLCAY